MCLSKTLDKKASVDPEILKNFRPISNLTFVLKILEQTVCKQLKEYLTTNDLMETFQWLSGASRFTGGLGPITCACNYYPSCCSSMLHIHRGAVTSTACHVSPQTSEHVLEPLGLHHTVFTINRPSSYVLVLLMTHVPRNHVTILLCKECSCPLPHQWQHRNLSMGTLVSG